MRTVLILGLLVPLLGCGGYASSPAPVEVSGTVTLGGRKVEGVTLNFITTGVGAQATVPVKDGEFRATMIPGQYTYFVSEGANPAVFKRIPEKVRTGSLDRQVTITGERLQIALD